MKTNIFKLAAMMLLLVGSLASCNKGDTDDLFLEISPESKSQAIENEIDGITFKFCLLNEQGQPATIFKEGENISFYFAMTNHGNDMLDTAGDLECELRSGDFGQVISWTQDTVSRPFNRYICTTGLYYQPFYGNDNHREVNFPWDSPQWSYRRGHFQQPDLPAGKYYTEVLSPEIILLNKIKCQLFSFRTVNFRINFKIE